jgi:hypothetical protein
VVTTQIIVNQYIFKFLCVLIFLAFVGTPIDKKELDELRIRHKEAMSFFNDIDKNDNIAIIEKFEPANVRDDFELTNITFL